MWPLLAAATPRDAKKVASKKAMKAMKTKIDKYAHDVRDAAAQAASLKVVQDASLEWYEIWRRSQSR